MDKQLQLEGGRIIIGVNLHDYDGKELPAKVSIAEYGIEIELEGYGTFSGVPGEPIFIEFYNGSPRVHVWSDITEEDPTDSISLINAREVLRDDNPF